ncbi:unnamed protein product [Cuscuta europaea]|uniref:Uncharacterized protein n=1 Tax=Cuscuta europaea TaxID=41803 RepID=A0A9P1DXJ8_CUSEU|nr:unnamed protein product [Cuscuta europaea]
MRRVEDQEDDEGGEGAAAGRSPSSSRCLDCGNQSKKECGFMRCRTCCKSRGFECATHVKSTWVPVSHRRLQRRSSRLLRLANPNNRFMQQQPPPRHRQNLPIFGADGSNFPAEVSFPAVFRCLRLRSVDHSREDTNHQYAYQTSVNIAGHVFKGILYDQGLDSRYKIGGAGSSGGRLQQLGTLIDSPSILHSYRE